MCDKKFVLICIPYAGGYSSSYSMWKRYLDKRITMSTLELSGRGTRLREPFYNSIQDAAEDLYCQLITKTELNDYVLFGHSMGSVLIYEIMQRVVKNGKRPPLHIILSGSTPVHYREKRKVISNLPDDKFKEELLTFKGISEEVLDNESLMEMFMPVLRADFRMLENYRCSEHLSKFPCDLSVFSGTEDRAVYEIHRWGELAEKKFELYEFQGEHFFIQSKEVAEKINEIVLKHIGEDR